MDKLIIGIVVSIILIGIAFWVFNNPDGIGKGVENGGKNVKEKIEQATSYNFHTLGREDPLYIRV